MNQTQILELPGKKHEATVALNFRKIEFTQIVQALKKGLDKGCSEIEVTMFDRETRNMELLKFELAENKVIHMYTGKLYTYGLANVKDVSEEFQSYFDNEFNGEYTLVAHSVYEDIEA